MTLGMVAYIYNSFEHSRGRGRNIIILWSAQGNLQESVSKYTKKPSHVTQWQSVSGAGQPPVTQEKCKSL